MSSEWQEFLLKRGAELKDDTVQAFSDPNPEKRMTIQDNILCDLSHMGLIEAKSEEAEQFLQSQFSNDARQVSESRGQLSAYCNPKGRMFAAFLIFKRNQSYLLRLPREILRPTLARLQMFILRTKVKLEDFSNTLMRIGYSGANAGRDLIEILGQVPEEHYDCVQSSGVTLIRIPGPYDRYEAYGELEEIKRLWTQLSDRSTPSGAGSWALLDILAGIPTILSQTREAFVPQMVNMDLLGGINFTKGCYPGQEIVARMHYLGTLKRRMYRIHIDSETSPAPGSDLFMFEGDTNEPIGKVVAAQTHPDGGSEALAVIHIDHATNGKLWLGNTAGPGITLQPLPYEFLGEN